ncbi:GNAT family N-acetyltransferase [Gryllotalpicola ginsengisoli]|uniref:GNAT family N-acetyltransferase n=1 Tax=Gryllotalpicola ginsengisoli TaxID=444608 RepID=UPI0003B4FF33|nr:GNAT family N-acetyltransferase [Gryllotalpicola ginsengisoli]
MAQIRRYEPRDRDDVYDVCVKTGDSGTDATGLFSDDTLLPDIYAGPYLALQPDLAFVVDTGTRVAGYLLAAADTRDFVRRYRAEWLPGFAARHPSPVRVESAEDRMVCTGHEPERMIGPDQDRYPAHLHIDLLPELQGQGLGRALIRMLLAELRSRGIPGVQLGVGEQNRGARAFYRRLGFHPLPSSPQNELVLGLEADAEV